MDAERTSVARATRIVGSASLGIARAAVFVIDAGLTFQVSDLGCSVVLLIGLKGAPALLSD
jgi:hypothetical protein